MPSIRLAVKVKPGVKSPGIEVRDGVMTVRLRERAIEGAANEALLKAVANYLGVAPSRVTLRRGARSRQKTVEIDGFSEEELREKLKA